MAHASSATTVDSTINAANTPEKIAAEATETVEVVISVNKLLFESVMSYKMRDVLQYVPAVKRTAAVEAKVNEMVRNLFISTDKQIRQSATLKALKATNPELFQ